MEAYLPGDAVDGWEMLASKVAFQQRVTVMRDRLRTPRGAEMDYVWVASELQPLGRFYPAPGMMSHCVHVFVAQAPQPGEPAHDEQEIVEVVMLPWDELVERVIHGDEALDVTLAFAVLRYAAQTQANTQAKS